MFITRFSSVVIAVLSILLLTQNAFSVGGISNTKVVVPGTETVPDGKYEIEPFFGMEFVDDDTDSRSFEAGSRFTYGFSESVEAGFNISYLTADDNDISDTDYNFGNISPGVKYRFFEYAGTNSLSLAYQGGITIPTGGSDEKWVYEPAGLILTTYITPELSVDSDIVLVIEEDDSWGVVSNIGVGYFITEILQPVLELGYEYNDPDEGKSTDRINITGGFTADVTEYLTCIFGVTRDIATNNTEDSLAVTAAFTFLF